jgi:hypothetical protein
MFDSVCFAATGSSDGDPSYGDGIQYQQASQKIQRNNIERQLFKKLIALRMKKQNTFPSSGRLWSRPQDSCLLFEIRFSFRNIVFEIIRGL